MPKKKDVLLELRSVGMLQVSSHLLFADDSLIPIRAKKEDAMQLHGILDLYEQCSG